MYEITITDDTMSYTMPPLEVSFNIDPIDASTDVTTLSNDVYTDQFPIKRVFADNYAFLTEAEYDILLGFWTRQKTGLFKYPRITIPAFGVVDLVCKFDLSGRKVVDLCGNVTGVSFSFRESKQNPTSS